MTPTLALALELRQKIEAGIPTARVVAAHTENEHYYKDTEDGAVYPSVTTKTSLLSRAYYKQLAADKAVDHIQQYLLSGAEMTPESLADTFAEARQAHAVALSQAGDWGTEAHDTVDKYLKAWIERGTKPPSIRDFAAPDISTYGMCGALSAELFISEHILFPVVSEKKVISKKHKYAGTLDSFFLVGDVKKSGKENCPGHAWIEKNRERLKCTWCKTEVKLIPTIIDWKTSNAILGHGAMGKYEYALQVGAYRKALIEMTGVQSKQNWIVRLDKGHPKYEVGIINDIKHATKMFLAMNQISDYARSSTPPIIARDQKEVIVL